MLWFTDCAFDSVPVSKRGDICNSCYDLELNMTAVPSWLRWFSVSQDNEQYFILCSRFSQFLVTRDQSNT